MVKNNKIEAEKFLINFGKKKKVKKLLFGNNNFRFVA